MLPISDSRPHEVRASWSACLAGIFRLPAAIRRSLNPTSEQEARKLEAQLDVVAESVKLFNFAFPIVGIVLLAIELRHAYFLGPWLSWGAILLASVASEILLHSTALSEDPIVRARERARTISLLTLVQTGCWVSLVFWAWQPENTVSNMFGVLVIACTMGAISMRLAPHAAAVAGPMVLLSAVMVVMESLHGVTGVMALFQLALVYTALMIFQAVAAHQRFNRTWTLEQDRERLIENLRTAKVESDQAHRDAIAASRAKSAFLANMSHELRTPLNAIIGFSEIVRSKAFGEASDRYPEYGGFIYQSGHHLLGLIGDILDLAKIESGRKKLMLEPVDVLSLVRDETERARAKATEKSVRVVLTLPNATPLLHADLHAVRQIVIHLLSNAVKYTPAEGKVEVSLTINENGEVEICVADSGIGIPQADQAHLFDRFGHARPEVTTPHRGSGLGLPIVKGLVDMHGGRISLTSELGEGTTVIVVFPAQSTLDSLGRVA